jgi:hypothetical protein
MLDPARRTPNSRVKDLIDLVLLIRSGNLAKERIAEAVRLTFERRKTHAVPSGLSAPPAEWSKQFLEMAAECRLPADMEEASAQVRAFFEVISRGWPK